jgi:hypothetical protein
MGRQRIGSSGALKIALGAVVIGIALLGQTTTGLAQYYGDLPWCAVINETDGEVIWLCQYRTFDECQPTLIGGNRGFCNVNPYYKPSVPAARKSGHRQTTGQ